MVRRENRDCHDALKSVVLHVKKEKNGKGLFIEVILVFGGGGRGGGAGGKSKPR